jgi:predicted DNA-binding transcriptional regulator AlpA
MARVVRTPAAAEHMNLSEWKLLQMARDSQIPHIKISARLILWDLDALDGWLTERVTASIRPAQDNKKIRRLI